MLGVGLSVRVGVRVSRSAFPTMCVGTNLRISLILPNLNPDRWNDQTTHGLNLRSRKACGCCLIKELRCIHMDGDMGLVELSRHSGIPAILVSSMNPKSPNLDPNLNPNLNPIQAFASTPL